MKKLIKLFVICLLITSCNKDDISSEIDSIEVDTIKNKESNSIMLEFNSSEELKNYINEKIESKTDLLEEAKNEVETKGRIPLLLVYNLQEEGDVEKLGIDSDNIPQVDTPDNMLLFLLNENGEISIKGKIFRIDGEFVYSYVPGEPNEISNFLEAYEHNEVSVEPEKITSFGKGLSFYKHNNPPSIKEKELSKSFLNHYFTNPFNGSSKYMVSQFWNNKWWFYQSIGASTKVKRQKKWYEFWYFWGDPVVKADNRLKYNINFQAAPFLGIGQATTLNYNGYNDCNNCNQVSKTFHWTISFEEESAYTEIKGKTEHWAHWYSSNPNVVYRTITP